MSKFDVFRIIPLIQGVALSVVQIIGYKNVTRDNATTTPPYRIYLACKPLREPTTTTSPLPCKSVQWTFANLGGIHVYPGFFKLTGVIVTKTEIKPHEPPSSTQHVISLSAST